MTTHHNDESATSSNPSETPPTVSGLHHVSALSGDPQEAVDFVSDVLGMRLVKRTVNYEDQFAHHIYFGDGSGSIGSVLTLFPSNAGPDGRVGPPQPGATALAIPEGSLDYWAGRLSAHGVAYTEFTRFGESGLAFTAPDGLPLELVATSQDSGSGFEPWADGPVPVEHAIQGLAGTTLLSPAPYQTARVLEHFGYELVAETDDRVRYQVPGDRARVVDLSLSGPRDSASTMGGFGRDGKGTVHHVAFGVPDRDALLSWHHYLRDIGLEPTRIKDRTYFQSVYLREPGGIRFELATEGPGLTVDEPVDELGGSLQLPRWVEDDREEIEKRLPPVEWPTA
ncbi:VOC family protein [Haloarchaeobius sp. HME9146]|uniref:VOC family protein n=1 Tax=Haloarchaeobius sp. HME9146 TaxID=2978732 RepID=UPI0021C156A2|nr:VOC family protein [Haloarchaeobius sp. HME9146]